MPPREVRPFAITSVIAAVSGALLALAINGAWLGAAVGRGADFCEAGRDALVRQPANTWSNLGFVVAGLAIAWRWRDPATRGPALGRAPGVATAGAVIVTLLGPGSAAMHATESELGGRLDLLSMYLIAALVLAYAATRLLRRGTGCFLVAFAGVVLACEIVGAAGGRVPVLVHSGNLAFAVALLAGLGIEVVLWRRGAGIDPRWGLAALGSLVLAFAVWNLGKSGSPWCHPDSLWQPHALWHLLCALAAYCQLRAYAASATERPAPPENLG